MPATVMVTWRRSLGFGVRGSSMADSSYPVFVGGTERPEREREVPLGMPGRRTFGTLLGQTDDRGVRLLRVRLIAGGPNTGRVLDPAEGNYVRAARDEGTAADRSGQGGREVGEVDPIDGRIGAGGEEPAGDGNVGVARHMLVQMSGNGRFASAEACARGVTLP